MVLVLMRYAAVEVEAVVAVEVEVVVWAALEAVAELLVEWAEVVLVEWDQVAALVAVAGLQEEWVPEVVVAGLLVEWVPEVVVPGLQEVEVAFLCPDRPWDSLGQGLQDLDHQDLVGILEGVRVGVLVEVGDGVGVPLGKTGLSGVPLITSTTLLKLDHPVVGHNVSTTV